MSLVNIKPETFSVLRDKVVVMAGTTSGIGAAAVAQLEEHGCNVVCGDIQEPPSSPTSARVTFVKTDITDYASVLALFQTAWSLHGRVDHAVSNAGVVEMEPLFTTGVDDASIAEAPSTKVIDINLTGSLYFTRVAVHFLRRSLAAHQHAIAGQAQQTDASLVLVSSVAGFGEFPGLFQYSGSKHGVAGLFRSTRNYLLPTEGVRVNMVMPNMTRTLMVAGVVAMYEAQGVPCNEPGDVAAAFLHGLASAETNGEALYVSGGKTYEIEKRLDEGARAMWLGKKVEEELRAGQRALGGGGNWSTSDKRQTGPRL